MASPFFGPPPLKMVGSPAPHGVVSPEIGSTTNTAEMMLGSAAAAGVSVGAMGGAEPAPGRPQLKMPPVPPMSTAPAVQLPVGPARPEFAQSTVAPLAGLNRIEPSTASHPEGAARAPSALTPTRNATTPAHASLGHGLFFIALL